MNEYWIGQYGDQYKIIDKVSDLGVSGATQGRFDWFVDGLVAAGLQDTGASWAL